MRAVTIELAGEELAARGSGALWLAAARVLVVADLHFGKAERHARRGGGFWPPYEATETLSRLEAEIDALGPERVIALGDSFDDARVVEGLALADRARIEALTARADWVWVSGNHDPAPTGFAGESVAEYRLGGLVLRHIAAAGAEPGEVSGHYHPKAMLRLRGRRIARKCFLHDQTRLILPAFGAFTGGLDVLDPALCALMGRGAAVVLTGERAIRVGVAELRGMQRLA